MIMMLAALTWAAVLQQASSLQHANNPTAVQYRRSRLDLGSDLESLKRHIDDSEREGYSEVEAKKLEYEKLLGAQYDRIDKVNAQIAILESLVAKRNKTCDTYRREAARLIEKSQAIRESFQVLDANMTTAQDFAREVITDATEKIHSSNETDILRVLAAADAANARNELISNSFPTASLKEAKKKRRQRKSESIAMLELAATPSHAETAQEMLNNLMTSVNELQDQQQKDLAALQMQFSEKMAEAGTELVRAQDKEAALEKDLAALEALESRLGVAYNTTKAEYDHLSTRGRALHRFVEKLAGKKR